MRTPSLVAALLVCACSPSPQHDGSASSRIADTTRAGGLYRIVGFDSLERKITDSLARAIGGHVLQFWVTLPAHLPENDVVVVANRIRDSVARVHPDLWSLRLYFDGPVTVLSRASRVAEFVWGPGGQTDPRRRRTAPHEWSSHYNPPARDSVLKALEDYGLWFGDDRATVISRLGAPDRIEATASQTPGDSIFALRYAAASFELSRGADHIEMLHEIRAWGPLPDLSKVVSLGATTRSDLLAKLGLSDYRSQTLADSSILSYALPERPTDLIEFYIVRDTLRLLRWRYRMG